MICLATSYTKDFAAIGDPASDTHRLYAAKHSFCSRILSDLDFRERPPAWHRIQWIPQLFDEGFEFVFWVDADAVFVRFDRDIREVITKEADLYLVRHSVDGQLIPNTGVMLIRNTLWSRRFLADVWNLKQYTLHHWWENAAVMHLLGYHHLLGEGAFRPKHDHVSFISEEWNSIPSICSAENPIIKHYAGHSLAQRERAVSADISVLLNQFH